MSAAFTVVAIQTEWTPAAMKPTTSGMLIRLLSLRAYGGHMNLYDLTNNWMRWKEAERLAVEHRRICEDSIVKLLSIPADLDGVDTQEVGDFELKISGRIDRKVDADKVQQLAAEAGLETHLSTLLRWKPEINMSAWKNADPSITTPLLGAVTSRPGRPSFAITYKKAR